MKGSVIGFVLVLAAVLLGGLVVGLARAQQGAQMPPGMMVAQSRMPMHQMTQQMQRQMAQMNVTTRSLRAQLDKINPDLLTGQQRPMYEYLKLLQSHLEAMNATMGSMQGMMMRMGR
ncbi:MAG: hypothetical protein WD140_06135 [bacterium]